MFKCSPKRCPYYGKSHPVGVREHGRYFNASAIPRALAEFVADYVHSTFFFQQIRSNKVAELSPEEEAEFNIAMSSD
jgi:hypothetical protein